MHCIFSDKITDSPLLDRHIKTNNGITSDVWLFTVQRVSHSVTFWHATYCCVSDLCVISDTIHATPCPYAPRHPLAPPTAPRELEIDKREIICVWRPKPAMRLRLIPVCGEVTAPTPLVLFQPILPWFHAPILHISRPNRSPVPWVCTSFPGLTPTPLLQRVYPYRHSFQLLINSTAHQVKLFVCTLM